MDFIAFFAASLVTVTIFALVFYLRATHADYKRSQARLRRAAARRAAYNAATRPRPVRDN